MSEGFAAKDRLVEDFKSVLKDVEHLLQESKGQLSEKTTVLRDKLDQEVHRARIRLEEFESTVKVQGEKAAKATDDYVHDHPWEAAGIGLGLGLLVGALLSSRR